MITPEIALPVATLQSARLRQFIIYDDLNASTAARWLAGEINTAASPICTVTSAMWKLEMATRFGVFREMTLQEAGEADVLIVAASDTSAADPALLQWLEALVPWRANRPQRGLLVGLLGEAATEVEQLNELTEAFGQFARRADLEFIWQPMGIHKVGDAGWAMAELERLISAN